jgi:DNA-binding beta-propeller fold protein YncE
MMTTPSTHDLLRQTVLQILIAVGSAAGSIQGVANGQEPPAPLATPRLLTTLPEICPTPDGMALDAQGNIILACPNYADQSHPAVLMKVDRENRVRLFCQMPIHPDTGVACPMGLAFGPDGDLFISDNQGWVKPNNKGRILRMELAGGQPTGSVVVAYGMSHPNGIRVHDGHIYVTQSLLVQEEGQPLISGVYRFKLDDAAVKVNNTLADPNLLATFKTLNPDCQYGADGLVFDSRGNLFVGNFGDGTLHKVTFNEDGSVASNTIFAKADFMKSTDGICVDPKDNIYVADFSNNAVCVVSPEGKVSLLARSPDCDGSDGGLDQPGEPLVRGNELIVSNFDMVTGPDKVNTAHDDPQTLSVIQLAE